MSNQPHSTIRKTARAQIAARRPEAIQGTGCSIWESLDMPRGIALQNGITYIHIGNPKHGERPPRFPNQPPRFR